MSTIIALLLSLHIFVLSPSVSAENRNLPGAGKPHTTGNQEIDIVQKRNVIVGDTVGM